MLNSSLRSRPEIDINEQNTSYGYSRVPFDLSPNGPDANEDSLDLKQSLALTPQQMDEDRMPLPTDFNEVRQSHEKKPYLHVQKINSIPFDKITHDR